MAAQAVAQAAYATIVTASALRTRPAASRGKTVHLAYRRGNGSSAGRSCRLSLAKLCVELCISSTRRSCRCQAAAGTSGADDADDGKAAAAAAFTQQLGPGDAIGKVIAAQANFMRVLVEAVGEGSIVEHNATANGVPEANLAVPAVGVELLCVVKAVMKKIKKRVLVGDSVIVRAIDWVDKRGMIEDVADRRNEIPDVAIANVDHLLLLFSLTRPALERKQLDKFLVAAEASGVPVTLALNKMDLIEPEIRDSWRERLEGWGYKPVMISVYTGQNVAELRPTLVDRVTVVAGPSGVGKSSLINHLRSNSVNGHDVAAETDLETQLAVGTVSERDGRGRHTTRHVELLKMPNGGLLADTPGFSQPSLNNISSEQLPMCFPEIRTRLETSACAFANCTHRAEPDCAARGDWERYDHYAALMNQVEKREQAERQTMNKRETSVRYKSKGSGATQMEPKLEMKKHRRESRRQRTQTLQDVLTEEKQEEESAAEEASLFNGHDSVPQTDAPLHTAVSLDNEQPSPSDSEQLSTKS
eukprot:jgi/Chlat1/5719/Chrsp38S05563